MKINTICNNYSKKRDGFSKPNNSFTFEREYIRALNATKLERLHSKPFIKCINYHRESVNFISTYENDVLSSSYGDIVLNNKKYLIDNKGAVLSNGNILIAKVNSLESWGVEEFKKANLEDSGLFSTNSLNIDLKPSIFSTNSLINGISVSDDILLYSNSGVDVIDFNKLTSKITLKSEEVINCKSGNVIFGCHNKTYSLWDTRTNIKIHTGNSGIRANDVTFHHRKPQLAIANEDSRIYLLDLRYLKSELAILRGHVNAVTSIDSYFNKEMNTSEIVSGSADSTLRIYNWSERKSRDVYYNKRMRNVTKVYYDKYIYSGSSDGSVRLWKPNSSIKLGPLNKKEMSSLKLKEILKEKYNFGEVNRIKNHRFLSKKLKGQIRTEKERYEGFLRREEKRKDRK